MIEPGEYFHRETLTLVNVRENYASGEVGVWIVGGGSDTVEESTFLRDYARNEPVTLEMLERMGWVAAMFDEGPVRHRFLRLSEHPIDLRWSDDGSFHVMFESYVERPLAPITTLRDLLNVLRVFGIEQPVMVP